MTNSSGRAAVRNMSKISQVLFEQGLRADKRFSQNFLVNQGALETIVSLSVTNPSTAVVEIGAGLGNLTELLAQAAAHVTSVELDRNFQPIHERYLSPYKNLRFVYGDFLQQEMSRLFEQAHEGDARVVVGNIPYSITAKILIKLLEEHEHFDRAYILMQKEVGERLRAPAGSKEYSVLAAKMRCAFAAHARLKITGRSFAPPPKVDSVLMEFIKRPNPLPIDVADRDAFFSMLDAAFGQRRKTLANSLSHSSGGVWTRDGIASILAQAGVSASIRAEELEIESFWDLFQRFRGELGPADFLIHRGEKSLKERAR